MPPTKPEAHGELILKGIGVSPGVAVGEALVFATEGVATSDLDISKDQIPLEIARYEEALIATRHQIAQMQKRVSSMLGDEHASIFDAHMLVVDDRYFVEEVIRELRARQKSVDGVVSEVSERYVDILAQMDDDYLRERAVDVRDVTRRIIRNLAGDRIDRMDQVDRQCIAVAHDFAPSDTAVIDRDTVLAFVTDQGSATSHTAIMARALEVPAVVGLHSASVQISAGETVLVDGSQGVVVVRPDSERLLEYARRAEDQRHILSELETLKDKPSETIDGYYVPIAANIELPTELDSIVRYGAKGIGLFRSEFMFLGDQALPDEEEQAAVYRDVVRSCAPDPVVIRTLDLGGDKFSSTVRVDPEMNPFLGWRAIRFCLANPAFFKKQLRAILRASAEHDNIAVMYPMISSADEVAEANRLLNESRDELQAEGVACAQTVRVGAMIEVPSAALTADQIAQHVDFFSIGTNDLIQYTLAVDRVNENVAHLYQPAHSAILELIRSVVKSAHSKRIPVAVCGQMAATPDFVPLLIGLGVDELSISPSSVPMVKDVIRNLRYTDCVELAKHARTAGCPEKVVSLCRGLLAKTSPEILELIS